MVAPAPLADSHSTFGLEPRLLEFNLLPSRTLHPVRAAQLLSDFGRVPDVLRGAGRIHRALHRRWSAELLKKLGPAAAPILDHAQPALPLALLGPESMARLARELGIMLLGRHLRHLIQRANVLAARADLGDEALAWACDGATQFHPGLRETGPWLADGLAAGADRLGCALLAQGWQDAEASLRMRADWKLSPDSEVPAARAASGLAPHEARPLCLQLLARLDPSWLSSFSATR